MASIDKYGSQSDTITSAALAPYAVTPNDSTDLATIPKGIWVGTGGDVRLRGVNSVADVTFKAVPSGFIIPVRASRILATGTTATDIVALA